MSETQIIRAGDIDEMFRAARFRDKIIAALPNQIKAERMIQLALTMIKASPSLLRCSPISLMACVMESAQLGLELDKILGHAYIVPFKGEASLIVGYKGYCHLIYQSGMVDAISAEVVRPKDKFKRTLGTSRQILHDPAPVPKNDDPETWIGAYAVIDLVTGKRIWDYMEASEIISARNRSKSWQMWIKEKKQTPWITDTLAMWKKTPIRRLAKLAPVSTTDKTKNLMRAVMLDEYGERPGLLKATEEGFVVSEEQEPIEPTLTQQLQESIELVEERKKKVAAKNAPTTTKPGPKAVASEKKMRAADAPPKATIPPAADPPVSGSQMTAIYHKAAQSGWRVPEEVSKWLQKNYRINSIKELRMSQVAEVLAKIESGT